MHITQPTEFKLPMFSSMIMMMPFTLGDPAKGGPGGGLSACLLNAESSTNPASSRAACEAHYYGSPLSSLTAFPLLAVLEFFCIAATLWFGASLVMRKMKNSGPQ